MASFDDILSLPGDAVLAKIVSLSPEQCDAFLSSPDLNTLLRKLSSSSSSQENEKTVEKLCALIESHPSLLHDPNETLEALISLLIHEKTSSLSLVEAASSSILNICLNNPSTHITTLTNAFHQEGIHSERSLRLMAVMVNLIQRGVLDSAMNEIIISQCRSKDLLIQMVSLEHLSAFAASKEGLQLLFQENIPHWLLSLSRGEDSGSESFIRSTALRLLTDILCDGYALDHGVTLNALTTSELEESLMAVLEANLLMKDEGCRAVAISSLARYAGSTTQSLAAIVGRKSLLQSWLGVLSSRLDPLVLGSLADVLRANPSIDESSSPPSQSIDMVIDLKKRLFAEASSMREGLPNALLQAARRPFLDIKLAAYRVMAALGSLPWGLAVLINIPGLREHLVDGNAETSREGKLAKFEVLVAVRGNPMLDLLTSEVVAGLDKAVQRGPFYAPPMMADPVVMER